MELTSNFPFWWFQIYFNFVCHLQIKREISTMKLIRHPNVIRMFEVRCESCLTILSRPYFLCMFLQPYNHLIFFFLELVLTLIFSLWKTCWLRFLWGSELTCQDTRYWCRLWQARQRYILFLSSLLAVNFLTKL